MAGASGTGKVCVMCGVDCSNRLRTKDSKGRYFCQPCVEKAKRAKQAKAATVEAVHDGDRSASMLDKLIADVPPVQSAGGCPHCHSPMTPNALICTSCGFNKQTGQQLHVQATTAKPKRDLSGAAGILTNPMLIGVGLLIVMGALAALASRDEALLLLYLTIVGLMQGVTSIVVLVFAFKESIGTGFLSLCVPCYILYFVLGVLDNAWVKMAYLVVLAAYLIGVIIAAANGMTLQEIRGF